MSLRLVSLILALLASIPAFAYPRLGNRSVTVLEGGERLMGPWADWSIADKNVGRACSKIRGLINPKTNELSAACKICYTEKFGHGNWPSRIPQLIRGEVLKVDLISSGGHSYISENYGCNYTGPGDEVECGGDNFALRAKSSQSNREVVIECTSDQELEIPEMNEIFKGALDFTQEF